MEVETIQVITSVIGTLGFPIVCAGAMFWQSIKEREMHKQESDKWVEAINRNTLVMQKIADKLDTDLEVEAK